MAPRAFARRPLPGNVGGAFWAGANARRVAGGHAREFGRERNSRNVVEFTRARRLLRGPRAPMGKMSLGATPRRVGGGRSDRHDARNASQGYSRANAPEWSDAAAVAVLTALHSCARDAGRGIVAQVKRVLSEKEEAERMVKV